ASASGAPSVCHMVASEDPRESINRLINWHVSVALDPCVSSDAQALIDRGKREAQPEPVSAADELAQLEPLIARSRALYEGVG
ncbi:hypothetical protein, partial [Lactococcus petauri]|uniref:hypothetical protein n=1 Tax=Lactococcus petauri TaxID=1940789 RepID=UPI0021F17CA7